MIDVEKARHWIIYTALFIAIIFFASFVKPHLPEGLETLPKWLSLVILFISAYFISMLLIYFYAKKSPEVIIWEALLFSLAVMVIFDVFGVYPSFIERALYAVSGRTPVTETVGRIIIPIIILTALFVIKKEKFDEIIGGGE